MNPRPLNLRGSCDMKSISSGSRRSLEALRLPRNPQPSPRKSHSATTYS